MKKCTFVILSAQIPEVVLTAVLANYPLAEAENVLRKIVLRLREISPNLSLLTRYMRQLAILARLRKLDQLTIKIIDEMPITYDITTDYLYLKGTQQGKEEGIVEGIAKGIAKGKVEGKQETLLLIIQNLSKNKDFTDEMIAQWVNLPVEAVRQLKIGIPIITPPAPTKKRKVVKKKPS